MTKRPTALIFDLDGTLVDSLQDIADAAGAALAPHGLGPYSAESIRPFVGRGALPLLISLTTLAPLSAEALDAAVQHFLQYYHDHVAGTSRLFPGVREVLAHFSDVPQLVVTNKSEKIARRVLEAVGLEKAFVGIYGSDSFPRKKPDPLPLLMALTNIAPPSPAAWMVGDSRYDMLAGRAAGLSTCGCLYGIGSPEEVQECSPDRVVSAPLDLIQALSS